MNKPHTECNLSLTYRRERIFLYHVPHHATTGCGAIILLREVAKHLP